MTMLARLALIAAFGGANVLGLTYAPAHAEAETIRVVAAYYSAATGPYFKKMAEEFDAANPGVDVKIEVVNWDDLLQKLMTDASGHANADIAVVATRWLLDFVKNDQVEPLDGYMDESFAKGFVGQFLTPGQIGGHTYGLPIAASARAMYYNKALLAQAGIAAPPSTWDELLADARKLHARGIAAFGIQGKEIETDKYWDYALWSFGGDVVDAQGHAAFASPAGVKALQLYKQMIDEGLTEPEPTAYSREDLQNLFKQGRLAMVITAPFLMNQIAHEAPKLDYGVAPVPSETRSVTYAVTDSVVMFKSSKAKATAWKFLKFLFTKDARVAFDRNEGFLPATVAAARDPFFAGNARLQAFVALLPHAKFAPTVTGEDGLAKAMTDALQSVYLGEAQPEPALRAAAAKADQALGQ